MHRHGFRITTRIALIVMVMTIAGCLSIVSAEENTQDIPSDAEKYTLTYPDGEVVTVNGTGEALTYDDVLAAIKADNWKLLGSGYTSGKDGKAFLPNGWTNGTIRIVETKVPTGYTAGDEQQKTVKLEDGQTVFVNPKIQAPASPKRSCQITYLLNGGSYNGSTDDIIERHREGDTITIHEAPVRDGYTFLYWQGSEYYPGDTYTVTGDHIFVAQWVNQSRPFIDDPNDPDDGDKDKGGPSTGDRNGTLFFLILFAASLAMIMTIWWARKGGRNAKSTIVTVLLVTALSAGAVSATSTGFTINKVDDNGDPVEGAVFDVYGKPEVTWEYAKPETRSITITKYWADSNIYAASNALGENGEYKRPDITFDIKGKVGESEVYNGTAVLTESDSIGEQGNYTVWKKTVEGLPKFSGDQEIVYTTYERMPTGFNIEDGPDTWDCYNYPRTETEDLPFTLNIKKIEAGDTTGAGLEGAVFTVKGPGLDDEGVDTDATNSDGKATIILPETGEYQITEKTPPTGYLLSDTVYYVILERSELKAIKLVDGNWMMQYDMKLGDGCSGDISVDAATGAATLTVPDTPESSTIDISGQKFWMIQGGSPLLPDDPQIPDTTLTLTLYRMVEGGSWEEVPDSRKDIPARSESTPPRYEWTGLPSTNPDGKPYKYKVGEVQYPSAYYPSGGTADENYNLTNVILQEP